MAEEKQNSNIIPPDTDLIPPRKPALQQIRPTIQSRSTTYGRVVYLHFACRAPLPIGSFLRVTSSQLWVPSGIGNTTGTGSTGVAATSALHHDRSGGGIDNGSGSVSNASTPASAVIGTTTLSPNDPTDAKALSLVANQSALPDNTTDGIGHHHQEYNNTYHDLSYASSVEMVTSPEEWPIWRTRTPVVIALKHHHGRIEHHRYRYLVVTPGLDGDEKDKDDDIMEAIDVGVPEWGGEGKENDSGSDGNDDEMAVDSERGVRNGLLGGGRTGRARERGLGVTTSSQNGASVGTQVMAWEDPFGDAKNNAQYQSNVSLPSVRRQAVSKTLANLPYRTIEIDTNSAKVRYNRTFSTRDKQQLQNSRAGEAMNEDNDADANNGNEDNDNLNLEYTSNGVQIDTWNRGEDFTFCPYILRNELNKQNKSRKIALSRFNTSTATVVSGDNNNDRVMDGNGNEVAGGGSTMRSRVSFNHLIEVAPTASGDGENDGDEMMDSTMTSLTMTPKMSMSAMSQHSSSTTRKQKRIFFVCFHLPVVLTRDLYTKKWTAVWAESLLAPTDGSNVVRNFNCHWIGTVSCDAESEEERDQIREVLAKMDCTPLFFDKKVKDDHYYGMCKKVLWPAFHNIDLLDLSANVVPDGVNVAKVQGAYRSSDWDQSRLDGWWKAFTCVNVAFADTLSNLLQPGDIMWVHDYHLSLLPKMVHDKEQTKYNGQTVTKKVFLLHIPFPTSQVFRELECGEAILEGMLHADVVGFHAFDHARHFLKAAKRIFGLNYESLIGGLIGVQLGRKTVLVTMHNVSIEPNMVTAALQMPSVAAGATVLRHNHTSRRIIAGIDIAQKLSGISLKLLAFERLLTDYPIWQEKIVMIQKCLIPGSRHEDEASTLQEVRYLVKRIKQKFGPHVIDCEEIVGSSLPIDQRLSLWKVADVLMVTPIREGLNLLPLEYVFTKKRPASPGVVISSEFSAVSSVLNGALRVNPFDIQMTVTNIDTALTMADDEKEGRRVRDEGFVSSSTSSQWTRHVLDDLDDATAVVNGFVSDNDSDDTSMMGTKFDKKDIITSTAAFLAQEREKGFSHLDMGAVVKAFNSTKRRVLLLDLNGTIVFKEPTGKYLKRDVLGSSGMIVESEVSNALNKLCADPNNIVFVVSGDSQENVEKAIGHIPGLGIAASNGACFAPPLKFDETRRKWKFFDLGVDWSVVKAIVMPILAKYTARSNGSFIKLTHSSIGWSYYSCDPEWGSLQASHLVLELEQALRAFDVRFVMIKGIVEIVPRLLNKGLIVKNVLREVQLRGDVDFILCMGDDIQDEKMFTSVFSFLAELEDPEHISPPLPVIDRNGATVASTASMSDESHHTLAISLPGGSQRNKENTPIYAYTSTVGKKESHALSYVDDARDVGSLLRMLTGKLNMQTQ